MRQASLSACIESVDINCQPNYAERIAMSSQAAVNSVWLYRTDVNHRMLGMLPGKSKESVPGSFLDSMKGKGDWFSSCFAVPSKFFRKALIYKQFQAVRYMCMCTALACSILDGDNCEQ